MTATTATATTAAGDTNAIRELNCYWLLALYALIPLSLLFEAIDMLWLDRWFINQMPNNPDVWPLWTLFLGFPHVVASLFTMVDRDYLAYYRKVLLWPILFFFGLCLAGTYGPAPWSRNGLFMFMGFYTVYHVFAQQLGLTLMMMSVPPNRTYKVWKWSSVSVAFLVYAMVYEPSVLIDIRFGSVNLSQVLEFIAPLAVAAVIVCTLRLSPASRSKVGTLYLWGNCALVVSIYIFFETHYEFFVIFVARIIHDVSAYMVYISHDSNRNRDRAHNYFYRFVRFTRLPAIVLLPLASIGVAYVMSSFEYIGWVSALILSLTALHYYFEGFIWRGTNPHRASVNFKR